MTIRRQTSSPTLGPGHPERLCVVLERCAPVLCGTLAPMLRSTLGRIDEVLYQLADEADGDARCAACFELQRELRGRRDAVERHVLRNLEMSLELFRDARHTIGLNLPSIPVGDALAPLDDSQPLVEPVDEAESQALARLISSAEARCRDQLDALVVALVPLVGRDDLTPGDLPMGPAALYQAFADAVRALPGCDSMIRPALYRVFETWVIDNLFEPYAGCLDQVRAVCTDADQDRAGQGR
jgi:hypothetical protein